MDVAIGQLRTQHWTVTMLHSSHGGAAARMLVGRVLDSTPTAGDRVLILRHGLTEVSPQGVSADLRVEELSPHHPVLVAYRQSAPPWVLSSEQETLPGSAVVLLLGVTTMVVLILAGLVAEDESRLCAPNCDGVPAAYGDALYWLLSRMIGGDPDGLGAAGPRSRILGFLMTIFGVYVLVTVIGRVLQQRMEEDARSGSEVVAAFEELRSPPSPTSGSAARPVPRPATDPGAPPVPGPQPPPPQQEPPQRQARTHAATGLLGLALGVLLGVVLRRAQD